MCEGLRMLDDGLLTIPHRWAKVSSWVICPLARILGINHSNSVRRPPV